MKLLFLSLIRTAPLSFAMGSVFLASSLVAVPPFLIGPEHLLFTQLPPLPCHRCYLPCHHFSIQKACLLIANITSALYFASLLVDLPTRHVFNRPSLCRLSRCCCCTCAHTARVLSLLTETANTLHGEQGHIICRSLLCSWLNHS